MRMVSTGYYRLADDADPKRIEICSHLLKQTHTLIAGTTGSGKSVFLNSILYTLIAEHPADVRMIGIDLKRVELSHWRNCPHTRSIATELDEAIEALDYTIELMEYRFEDMEERGLRETDQYHVYVVIDELADLLQLGGKAVRDRLTRIGRLGRAAHIHMILCTQSPNRKVLDASILQNIGCAVALRCRSAIESRQIIGVKGAELLPRYGCGIMWDAEGIKSISIPMVSDKDIERQQRCYERVEVKDNRPIWKKLFGGK